MAISIQVNGQYLQLPTNGGVTHRRTNPIYTTQGSYSYPIIVPPTPYNFGVLQHPEMLDNARAYKFTPPATIDAHGRRIAGTFNFNKVDKKNGVSFNVDTYEGDFWADTKKRMLADIEWGGERIDNITKTGSLYGWNLEFKLGNTDYSIFPVVVAKSDSEIQLINKPSFYSWVYADDLDNYPNGNIDLWITDTFMFSAVNSYLDDEVVPINYQKYNMYSVAPFLYLNTIIRYIAAHYKLTVQRNDITSSPYLSRMVVLHNTVDAFSRAGSAPSEVYRLNYKYLLPTISISEFIAAVERKFMLKFFVDFEGKTLNIISLNEVRKARPTKDLTPYLAAPIASLSEERKPRRLKNDNGSSATAVVSELYGDFKSKYPDVVYGQTPESGTPTGDLYFEYPQRSFFWQKEDESGAVVGKEVMSSPFFFSGSSEDEVIESKDVSMQTVEVNRTFGINIIGNNGQVEVGTSIDVSSLCPFFDSGGVRQQRDYGLQLKNSTDKCPLAFAHVNAPEVEPGYVPNIANGATIVKDGFSMLYANVPLYEGQTSFNTLHEVFHKPVLAWLNASGYPYEATLRVPPHIMNDLKPWEPFMLGNQAYLFEEIKEQYSTTRGVLPQTFKLRSVKMV